MIILDFIFIGNKLQSPNVYFIILYMLKDEHRLNLGYWYIENVSMNQEEASHVRKRFKPALSLLDLTLLGVECIQGIERTMPPDLVASLQYTQPCIVANHNIDANQRYSHTKP
jgi:hypothetical protein